MSPPSLARTALAGTAASYREALAEGCTGLGVPVGTGKRSAASYIAAALGVSHGTAYRWLVAARDAGLLDAVASAEPQPDAPPEKPRVRVRAKSDALPADLPDQVLALIRSHPRKLPEIAAALRVDADAIAAAMGALTNGDVRLEEDHEGRWTVSREGPPPAWLAGPLHSFTTDADNTFTFGASGDQHLGSKYERLDVCDMLYDAFADAGCGVVFNTGNWIDGEARFNKHDLHTHGMDAQVRHLVAEFPRRAGIATYAITGDDHEGWYAQREGVDIGRYAERSFRDAGRADWVDLGYMEAPVRIVNASTGRDAIMAVVHPGGGSSYALSYSIQKIIESLDGGEKPAVGLYGHYHKLWYGNIRNVWCVQTGTCQDQTPFMRKKKLEAHVGGAIVKLTQDPATGAIVRCQVELLRFFNKGYYANRWSHSGSVTQGQRVAPGIV